MNVTRLLKNIKIAYFCSEKQGKCATALYLKTLRKKRIYCFFHSLVLNLIANNKGTRDIWIKALQNCMKKNMGSKELIANDKFKEIDKDGDNQLDLKELEIFLASINLKIKRVELLKMLKVNGRIF